MGSTCVFSTVFVLLIHSEAIVGDRNLKAIDHLQVLARHGERYPLFPVPELGEFVIGGLTPQGFKVEEAFGTRLRERYSEFFGATPSVASISANQSRCTDTANAIIKGLNIEEFGVELLHMIDIVDINVTVLLPLLREASRIQLPACVQEAVTNVVTPAMETYPPSVSALLEVFFKAQLSDTIDTLVQSGYTGAAFGVNLGKCIPPGKKLVTEEAFAKLTELCAHSQCTGVVSRVKEELEQFAAQNYPPEAIRKSASVYGLTDVHVLDLLNSLLPQFDHTRPQFGGYILLETRGDDVTILTGQDVLSQPQERATLNVYEVITLLRRRILSA